MNISQCLNPDCLAKNPPNYKFCQQCGAKLLLCDRYRAIRYLGEGGFGRTFVAEDEYRLNTTCVIKQFLPVQVGTSALEKATDLFKREAKQLCELGTHPQIPDLLAFFEQDGRLYLVQEFIEGQDLLKEAKKGRFSEDKIRQLLTELLPVLQFIHDKNIVHRDIKPENIIRRTNGKLVLIDFGIAKELNATTGTRMGTITGTFGYAAPEQMRGTVYPSSDLYSLGVTAIRLLTGCLPEDEGSDPLFDPIEMRWLWREWAQKHGISVSPNLAKVLDKMLKERIKERFQSATEVLQALNTQTRQFSTPTLIQGTSVSSPPPVRTNIPSRGVPATPKQPLKKLPVKLVSAVGIDYYPLHNLLVQGKWEQANQETARVILRATRRERDGWIKDISILPAEDLRTIDQLWMKASNERFGFSVQKRLWFSFGGKEDAETEARLGAVLGWWQNGDWINYSELEFADSAPRGHLPVVWGISRVPGWAGVFYVLFSIVNAGLLG